MREFRLEHDRAMGYIPRVTSPVQDIVALAMQVFQPPPSIQPIMETFRTWINSDRLATFDCFQEPSWECLAISVPLGAQKENQKLILWRGLWMNMSERPYSEM